jgi:cytidylate kinase
MAVVTISRQYGSGGSDIARLVAGKLGWELVDNQFVDQVAARAGLSREEVAQREERVPGFVERLARALAISSPEVLVAAPDVPDSMSREERIVRVTERVIAEATQHGDVVIVGRGAQAYLASRGGVLHVYIVAPREVRIAAAMKRLGVGRKDAERKVDETDEGRRRYVKAHYDRQWDHPANYHLVVNSAEFGGEGAAELIVAAAGITGGNR